MKNMEYTPEIHKPITLDEGSISEFDYVISSFGTHPVTYVRIPDNHPYYKKSCDDLDIACHGGLTISGDNLEAIPDKKGWWLGWDYAHAGDYLGFSDMLKITS